MYKKIEFVLLLIVLIAAMSACSPAPAAVLPTPTVDSAATQAAADAASAEAAASADAAAKAGTAEAASKAATVEAEATAAVEATAAAAQTATAEAAAAKATKAASQSATAQAKKAAAATAEAEFVAMATEMAGGLAELVDELHKSGDLKRSGGAFYPYDDFDESWAQLGWYDFWPLDIESPNYIIRSHFAWEMATNIPDPSGCGYVFRLNEKGDHYMIFLANTGYAWAQMYKNGLYTNMGKAYAEKVDPIKGEADTMLVVEDSKFSFYVNDKRILRLESQGIPTGRPALTLVSGTNKDFGTRCQMTGIEVWDLGE